MTLFDEIKNLKKEIMRQEKRIEALNSRITQLTAQLADAQFGSRAKDHIIAQKEVIIREFEEELRGKSFLG